MAESGSPEDGSDRRAWIKVGLWTLAVVAFLVLFLGTTCRYEVVTTLQCPHCLSTRGDWREGIHVPGFRTFASTPRSEMHESPASTEVFHGKCVHSWHLRALSPSGRPPRGMLKAFQAGMMSAVQFEGNALSCAYESSPDFRALVQERMASGALARKRAIELFSLPARPNPNQVADPSWRLDLDEANALLEAAGLPPHPAWAAPRPK